VVSAIDITKTPRISRRPECYRGHPLKYRISDRVAISETPQGPLSSYLRSFSEALEVQGYARLVIQRQVMLAACFSRWLKQKGIERSQVTLDHPARYLRSRYQRLRPIKGDSGALSNFMEFLRREKVIPEGPVLAPRSPVDACMARYRRYLHDDRGLAEDTIVGYVRYSERFLRDVFGNGPVTFSKMEARHVVQFVQRQAKRMQRKGAKHMTTALRSFFRYLRYIGSLRIDLIAAVPVVANWSQTSIPRGIASEQVSRLLSQVDRRTAVGKRDYAILLLLARLGLRSREVAFLELDDIDWQAGSLSARAKGGTRLQLPLPTEVGEAIVAYLRDGRPTSSSRRVFLRASAPYRGFLGQRSVGSIVRTALLRAGIDAPTTGAHQFRHGLATDMLRQGASLVEIGQVLGHKNAQTTRIYAKVDLDGLRTLALPWPGCRS
jgi:integrase/recombinase XerD